MEIKKSITIQSYRLKFIMIVSYLMHKNNSLCFSVIFPINNVIYALCFLCSRICFNSSYSVLAIFLSIFAAFRNAK